MVKKLLKDIQLDYQFHWPVFFETKQNYDNFHQKIEKYLNCFKTGQDFSHRNFQNKLFTRFLNAQALYSVQTRICISERFLMISARK